MIAQPAPLDLQTLRRFIRAVTELLTSELRRKAIVLLFLLLALALSVNGLNVVSSYVGRDFMTAIAYHDMAGFVWLAILYIGLFAAMTVVAAIDLVFGHGHYPLIWIGKPTSLFIARQVMTRSVFDQNQTHALWLVPRLGLDRYSIEVVPPQEIPKWKCVLCRCPD
jgi:ABC-type uncharacterized transport system fused permease/ATPase subunit